MAENKSKAATLWWIAFGCETLAAVLEAAARNYLKAVGLSALALSFLLLATSGGDDAKPSRKIVFYILICVAVGLLVYEIFAR